LKEELFSKQDFTIQLITKSDLLLGKAIQDICFSLPITYLMNTSKLKAIIAVVCAMLIMITSSCATTKKDCRGHKKHLQANGVWL